MKKITDIKEGDLLTLEEIMKILRIPKKTLYDWSLKSKREPEKYPRCFKLGRHLFFLKSDILERINRQFNKAS